MDDIKWLTIAAKRKHAITPPSQSLFRVYSIITYQDNLGQWEYSTGTNSECCFIGSCLCAERSAAVQLRERSVARIGSIYLCADMSDCLTPGLLCREYLSSQPHFTSKVRIVMAGTKEDKIIESTIRETTLGQLYPCLSVHNGINRNNLVLFSVDFSSNMKKFSEFSKSSDELKLYESVFRLAQETNVIGNKIHPVNYAAGVLFSDGSVSTSLCVKAMEYGNTIEATVLLIKDIIITKKKNIEPILVIQTDQWGILHAPFANARSFLFEYDFLRCEVLSHLKSGEIVRKSVEDLVPDSPKVSEVFGIC